MGKSNLVWLPTFVIISYLQNTGTFKKNLNIMKKVNIFLSLISESETHILYRFITHRVKYFKPLFLEILMIMTYR